MDRVWFVLDRPEVEPVIDTDLLNLTERRVCQYFLDWSSRKPGAVGISQDRSTFGDLLTVGGIGFGLPAFVICAERGWISREEGAELTLPAGLTLDAFGGPNAAVRTKSSEGSATSPSAES